MIAWKKRVKGYQKMLMSKAVQKYRITSDWHMDTWASVCGRKRDEVGKFILDQVLPVMDGEKDMILLMAGDVAPFGYWTVGGRNAEAHVMWAMRELCERFKEVHFVPGNHEFWGWDMTEWEYGKGDKDHPVKRLPQNFKVFGPDRKSGDVSVARMNGRCGWRHTDVVGATLWTDYMRGDVVAMNVARECMLDYAHIGVRDGGVEEKMRPVTPGELYEVHKAHKKALLCHGSEGGVIMTHHAPSRMSVHPKYRGPAGSKKDLLNYAFSSDLDCMVEVIQPALWVHGHTHYGFDYRIGKTRVICNPFGYPEFEKDTGYRPCLVVAI